MARVASSGGSGSVRRGWVGSGAGVDPEVGSERPDFLSEPFPKSQSYWSGMGQTVPCGP